MSVVLVEDSLLLSQNSELQPLTEADGNDCNSVSDNASTTSTVQRRADAFKAYSERWYILVMFSVINVMQTAVYNTFGPISSSAVVAFSLTQTDIALLPNWANIVYLFSVAPFVYLINSKGLRLPVLLTAAFVLAGSSVRLLHFGDNYRPFLHLGQLLNSFAGPVTFFACTAVSSVWFPPKERTLATGVTMLTANIGSAFAFLIGPSFVKWLADDATDPEAVRNSLVALFTFEAVLSSFLLVAVIYSFRSKPPTPPSFSATTERSPIQSALKLIFSSRDCWIAIIVYSLSSGVWGGWLSILSWIVRSRVSEEEAGWMGFASTIAGAFTGMLISAIASRFQRHAKLFVMVTMALCALLVTWHVLTYNFWTSLYTRAGIWLCVVGTSAGLSSGQPLLWELCCELAYPAPESVVTAVLSIGNSLISAILLIIAMAPSLGTAWMDWALAGSLWICLPLLLFYRPVNRRSALDS